MRSKDLFSIIDFELSLFHIDIENLVAAGRGSVFKNLGKVETMGSEFTSKIDFNNKTKISFFPTIYFSHTYLKTNIKSASLNQYNFMGEAKAISIAGNKLPYAPVKTFILGLEKK